MDKTDHLMAEKSKINKDSQKGQVTPKKKKLKVQCKSTGSKAASRTQMELIPWLPQKCRSE